jgi:hypothetical protein
VQSFSLDYGLFYLRPAIEERYIEGCLERIGEDDPEEQQLFRDLWDDETQQEAVIESLKADSVRSGRGGGLLRVFERSAQVRGECLCGGG